MISDPLGLDEEMAAYAVYEMVCENMASAARVYIKTKYMRLDNFNAAAARKLLSGMSRDIRAWVEPAAAGEPVVERRVAFMRCVGQGHEIAVELPVRDLLATDPAALRARYEADYEKMFRRSIPAAAIEIMAWSVNVSTVSQLLEQNADVDQYPLSLVGKSIRIFDGGAGKPIDASRYRRDKLSVGARRSGPAIIAEEKTSTFVTENFDV